MRVTYIGPSADGVTVPDLDLHCPAGGTIEVTDERGAEMIRQDVWKAAPTKAARAADKES